MELGFFKEKNGPGSASLFCLLAYFFLVLRFANGVVLHERNLSSFPSVEANFASALEDNGEVGILFLAEPLDACAPLTNEVFNGSKSPFALIIRGGCTFDEKVRHAQVAGFAAAVVYNNEDSRVLVTMAGNPEGIMVPAVFVSGFSGKVLKKYAGHTDSLLWIAPNLEDFEWPLTTLYLTLLLVVAIIVILGFFTCQRYVRPARSRSNQSPGISGQIVKQMPSIRFSTNLEDWCISRACAICLEDYKEGETLRVLPCHHEFHASCVDTWLMMWKSFCPLCKQDVRVHTGKPPANESTPLLSSVHASPSSTIDVTTIPNRMDSLLPRPTPSSLVHLLFHTADAITSPFSYASPLNSRPINFRNSAVQAPMVSPHSDTFPFSFPLCSRYYSSPIANSDNASTSSLSSSFP